MPARATPAGAAAESPPGASPTGRVGGGTSLRSAVRAGAPACPTPRRASSMRSRAIGARYGLRPIGIALERAETSAPRSTSSRTASGCSFAAAHINAVVPRSSSAASTAAPRSSSTASTSTRPVRAASISGVSPPGSRSFGSAPASISRATSAAPAPAQASDSGVTPARFLAVTSAPAAISSSAIGRSSRYAAQWSAVAPSAARPPASAPRSRSVPTAAPSPPRTASISGVSAAGAGEPGTDDSRIASIAGRGRNRRWRMISLFRRSYRCRLEARLRLRRQPSRATAPPAGPCCRRCGRGARRTCP